MSVDRALGTARLPAPRAYTTLYSDTAMMLFLPILQLTDLLLSWIIISASGYYPSLFLLVYRQRGVGFWTHSFRALTSSTLPSAHRNCTVVSQTLYYSPQAKSTCRLHWFPPYRSGGANASKPYCNRRRRAQRGGDLSQSSCSSKLLSAWRPVRTQTTVSYYYLHH